MPTSPLTKRLLLGAGVGLLVLLLFGFIIGAVGSEFAGSDPYLEKPAVHLPAQAVFPADKRQEAAEGGNLGWTGFAITNSMLSSWLTTLVLISIFLIAASKKKLIPGRLQSFVEVIIEGLLSFVEGVAGRELSKKFFPVIATIFLFVLFNAWMGLLPIYPSLGFDPPDVAKVEQGAGAGGEEMGKKEHEVSRVDLLRPAGTDINMPLALALVAFVFVEFWGLRRLGFSYFGKFIRVRTLLRGPKYLFAGMIDAFVGMLEGLSEVIRLVSFTFRLFGNMLAGKLLILISAFLVPFVFSVPFYGLEILVGFVQALIFAGLTLTFAALAVTHHEE